MEYNKKLFETVLSIAKNFADLSTKVETDTSLPFEEVFPAKTQFVKTESSASTDTAPPKPAPLLE